MIKMTVGELRKRLDVARKNNRLYKEQLREAYLCRVMEKVNGSFSRKYLGFLGFKKLNDTEDALQYIKDSDCLSNPTYWEYLLNTSGNTIAASTVDTLLAATRQESCDAEVTLTAEQMMCINYLYTLKVN